MNSVESNWPNLDKLLVIWLLLASGEKRKDDSSSTEGYNSNDRLKRRKTDGSQR